MKRSRSSLCRTPRNAILAVAGLCAVLATSGCSVALPAMAGRIGTRKPSSPEALRRVPSGRTITVGLGSGETVTGRYLGLTGSEADSANPATASMASFRLGRDSGPVEIAWDDVVWLRTIPAWKTMLPAFFVGLTIDVLLFREVLDRYGAGTDL